MITPNTSLQICRFLCADMRFGRLSILNDQGWAFGSGLAEPKALSLLTTYGLRAARMHIFPQFSVEDLVIQDPEKFQSRPVVSFSSACFLCSAFSPFPSLDVEYRTWVPDSQVLVGQITCSNNGGHMLTVDVNWRVHLQPIQGGSPMKHIQAGLNNTMVGECADLHPVFYLTGGPAPSMTDFPGLGNKILLMPGARRQVTWALASLTSVEDSTQQARQFSSRSLELEQIKIEMADKSVKVYCESSQAAIAENLQRSQDRAFQLLMPALRKLTHNTYVSSRSPDSGNYSSENILEIQPEWTGQTLPEVYLLSLILLPGRPEALKGILQNFLKIQQQDGRIDLRASVNHNLTGHSSLPLMATLVSDLHQYLNDITWLAEIFPQLLAFLRTWVQLDDDGGLEISPLTHPLQLGFDDATAEANTGLVDLWIRLLDPHNIFLVSLLYREVSELLHIARLIHQENEIDWLVAIREKLKVEAAALMQDAAGNPLPAAPGHPRTVLTSFTCGGLPRLKHNLAHPGKIYLRLDQVEKLSPDLNCSISGFTTGKFIEKNLKASDFHPVGLSYLYISAEEFEFIESINITKLPEGAQGEIGLIELDCSYILDQLVCFAGILTGQQVNKLTTRVRLNPHLTADGISIFPAAETEQSLSLPSYLAAMIIDGLLKYGRYEPAGLLFKLHFLKDQAQVKPAVAILPQCPTMRIENLVPHRLFLKLHGLMKLSNQEIVIAHHSGKQPPVTVQYNQLELLIRHNLTEVHLQSGEVIYLNQPGINKILLE